MRTQVRIDGEPIDLTENIRMPVERTNPHLSYETIPNSKAAIPNIPFSLLNQQLFEFAEMPQAGNQLRRFLCELLYNGAQVYRGLAWVKSSNPKAGYQLEVSDDLNFFFGVYQNTAMNELDLGTIPLPQPLTPMVAHEGMDSVCFPTIINPDYYSTNGPAIGYGGRVNPYSGGTYQSNGPQVPMLTVNYLLHRIAQLTGVTIQGNYLSHPTWSKLVLANWRALDGETSVDVRRHVPAWTIPQFIIELRKVPNLELTFDSTEKRLTIDFWEDKLALPPAVDWTTKAAPGHDKFPEVNRRLQLAFELDGNDNLMKDKPELMADYMTPAEDVMGDVEVGLAKVPFRLSTFLLDNTTGLPMAKQTGVTKEFNQLGVDTSPRLLFWNGVVAGADANHYPTALPSLNGISLYLTGPDGIAATSWQRTEAMRLSMFYLKKDFILTETDLATLDFSRSIHYNGLNYLVAHVSAELDIKKASTCLLVKY